MSIWLITGLPGAGKTLKAMMLADQFTKEGRQVYVANVRGLTRTDWLPCDPRKWMDLPDGSVVFVDEVQDFFPQRGARDPMPDAVARLDKHRHRGFTFIFTCQYPKQVDFALRGFVDRHLHLRRNFGLSTSTVIELDRCIDIDDKGDINKALKTAFRFPKEAFGWYQSATEHNMKVRIPARVLAFPVLIVGVLGLVWAAYTTISGWGDKVSKLDGGQLMGNAAIPAAAGVPGGSGVAAAAPRPVLANVAAYQARIPGLAFTAPRYDDVAKPVRAPYPAACVYMASAGCKCFTQQGTPYSTPEALCKQIVAGGFFLDFEPDPKRREDGSTRVAAAVRVDGAAAPEKPATGGLTVFEAPAARQVAASTLTKGGK